ncbi:hypothetical protein I7I48_11741 [Histoplasma ohiense]|nr:hypothetical protein I7I48_11741 [Histoplasma ohiense (nom. inval.)]
MLLSLPCSKHSALRRTGLYRETAKVPLYCVWVLRERSDGLYLPNKLLSSGGPEFAPEEPVRSGRGTCASDY